MSLVLIPVKVTAKRADGTPVAGASVRAVLTVAEVDEGLVVPAGVTGTTDGAGEATFNLWPNSRGVNGSQYRVEIEATGLYFSGLVTIPEAPSSAWPVALETLINQPPYPARSTAELAQAKSLEYKLAAEAAAAQAEAAKANSVYQFDASYPENSLAAEIQRLAARMLLLAGLATDNSWKHPHWTLLPHGSAPTPDNVHQGVAFDLTRGYIYSHHNTMVGPDEAGVITRYVIGPKGPLAAESFQNASVSIGHSGMAVEEATGKLWVGTGGIDAMRFTYTAGGAAANVEMYQFDAADGGKVQISFDQRYIVWQRRSGSTITYRLFLLSAVIAHGPGNCSALKVAEFTLERNDDVVNLQSHASDGLYVYTAGNLQTIKDPGQLIVQDLAGRVVFTAPNFNPGQASIGIGGIASHWEIEAMQFVNLGGHIPCLAVGVAGAEGSSNRSCIYLFGPGSDQAGFVQDRAIGFFPTICIGNVPVLGQVPSGERPAFQQRAVTQETAYSLYECASSSDGAEVGSVFMRTKSGAVGVHGNVANGTNLTKSTWYASFGASWQQTGYAFSEVLNPTAGSVGMNFGLATTGTGDNTPFVKFDVRRDSTHLYSKAGYPTTISDRGDTGHIHLLKTIGVTRGSIYSSSANVVFTGLNGNDVMMGFSSGDETTSITTRWRWMNLTGVQRPVVNNTVSFGDATSSVTQVFANTGTIGTSDGRLKADRNGVPLGVDWHTSPLTNPELAAAKGLSQAIGIYKWQDAVAQKGAAARLHVGLAVQRVIAVMADHGLDAFTYGFVCYDVWEDEDEVTQVVKVPAVFDEEGAELIPETTRVELVVPATAAGDRYSLREGELLLFMARAQEQRLAAVEAALA